MTLILASASPRRKELLETAKIKFIVEPAKINEELIPGESPEKMVARLAYEKAAFVAEKHKNSFVLGADTTVVCEDRILGKPKNKKEAGEMLSLIQGKIHEVWGGFSLIHREHDLVHTETHMTHVKMSELKQSEIEEYVETGEPLDKAGAYGIQGYGSVLVESIIGSYTNVVGLNIRAVIRALRLHEHTH
jgi:septum formation protein